MSIIKKAIPYGLMATSILTRVLPHPPNFTATNSTLVYGNTVLKKLYNIIVPLIIFIISDGINSLVKENSPWFGIFSVYNYLTYIITSVLTRLIMQNEKTIKVWKASVMCISSSFIFFIVTNFGVWASYGGSSLIQIYIDGIEFYGWEQLANFTYLVAFLIIHYIFVETELVLKDSDKTHDSGLDINENNKIDKESSKENLI